MRVRLEVSVDDQEGHERGRFLSHHLGPFLVDGLVRGHELALVGEEDGALLVRDVGDALRRVALLRWGIAWCGCEVPGKVKIN